MILHDQGRNNMRRPEHGMAEKVIHGNAEVLICDLCVLQRRLSEGDLGLSSFVSCFAPFREGALHGFTQSLAPLTF